MCSTLENMTADVWLSDEYNHMKLLDAHISQIPEIGYVANHNLRDGQLVRFRGMIQDMADPVLYLRRYELTNQKTGTSKVCSGKYKDSLAIEEDEILNEESPEQVHSERRSVYCVSIPALNSWARPPVTSLTLVQSSEQNHDVEMETCQSSSSQIKRSAEQMDEDVLEAGDSTLESDKTKRQQTDASVDSKPSEILLNHPIEGTNNYSCLINVYEELDESIIKMNTIVDAVGFISFTQDCDDFKHLPSTLVPRLHAISVKPIQHSNPFCSTIINQDEILMKAEKIRNDIMSILVKLFLGDCLVAEYVLCNLISKIYHRNEVLTLGHFSINITKVPVDINYTEQVFQILTQLVPKSHYLPMTLENMNSTKFLPEKDFEHNCLKSGILQLSNHTHLFVDETKLEPGQLNNNGVLNMRALTELVADQKSDYDFKYVKIEIPMDIPVIVMSEGKSLLQPSVQLMLTPETTQGTAEVCLSSVKQMLSNESLLSDIRQYLSLLVHLDFNLADELIETIQHDYVKLRQEERRVNESDLHLLLILSRLVSLSYGKTTLTKEMWDKAFDLELFRKERINNREP